MIDASMKYQTAFLKRAITKKKIEVFVNFIVA